MEISTETSELRNTRKHIVRGPIDFDQVKAYLGEIYRSPGGTTSMHVLWDLRDVDFTSISAETVRSLMEYVSRHWGVEGGRKAAIVVAPELDYATSTTYQMLMDGASASTFRIFKRIGEAEEWIAAGIS